MINAVAAVEEGESIRHAALLYNVPKSTLSDRISGRVVHGKKSGPQPYLTLAEEEELASFLIGCASIGHPRTRKDVLCLVQEVMDAKGLRSTVSSGWWTRFRERHPDITQRSAVPLSLARAKATDSKVIEKYFDLLETTLLDNNLQDKPSQIFNCDETGMPLSPKCHRVVDRVGAKNPCYVTGNDKSQVTIRVLSASSHSTPHHSGLLSRSSSSPHLNTPDGEDSQNDRVLLRRNETFIGKFLKLPQKPSDIPTKYEKVSGRVLTSVENRAMVKEKEDMKKKKQREKEEHAQLRKERAEAKKKKSKSGDQDFSLVFPETTLDAGKGK